MIGPLICGPLYSFVGMGAPYLFGAAIMLPVLLLLAQFRLQRAPGEIDPREIDPREIDPREIDKR